MGSAEAPTDEVGVGLAAGAPQLPGEVRGHPVGADDARQRGEVIGGQPRFGDGDVAFGDAGQGLVDAEALGEQRAHATRQRLGLVRGALEVELHRRAGNSDAFLAALANIKTVFVFYGCGVIVRICTLNRNAVLPIISFIIRTSAHQA